MELNELIVRYGNNKTEMDSYKKQVDADSKEIKEIMSEKQLQEVVAGGYKAKYSVYKSESFNEDKLLFTLQQMNIQDDLDVSEIIKTKEYVDMEALENAIYQGYVNAPSLADCKETKETARLTISKVK